MFLKQITLKSTVKINTLCIPKWDCVVYTKEDAGNKTYLFVIKKSRYKLCP